MSETKKFYPAETKRKPVQKAGRAKAQQLIEPIRSLIPRQFRETRDTEPIARYVDATRPSTQDVVMAGHEDRLDALEQRVGAVETRMGMGRAAGSTGKLALVVRRTA